MDSIDILINQPVIKIGRAGDLCWILFGEIYKEKNALGKDTEKGEYSLHLQCPWRIRNIEDSKIKLASGDIYEPSSCAEWSESFDWDVYGNNLFDEKIENLFSKEELVSVKKHYISKNGDLEIVFSNNLMLECFITVSTNEECWRFFKRGSKEHLIIYGVL